jgi:hypothetical protein
VTSVFVVKERINAFLEVDDVGENQILAIVYNPSVVGVFVVRVEDTDVLLLYLNGACP